MRPGQLRGLRTEKLLAVFSGVMKRQEEDAPSTGLPVGEGGDMGRSGTRTGRCEDARGWLLRGTASNARLLSLGD